MNLSQIVITFLSSAVTFVLQMSENGVLWNISIIGIAQQYFGQPMQTAEQILFCQVSKHITKHKSSMCVSR